ncbi:uncharacterized protein METZ01_LOCUS336620 [marine metagenome]|uniref:Uncharacterized protein n=1 Tax=marine metagenome TaxID=408172 RepID=A0A382QE99_9ZZZZ
MLLEIKKKDTTEEKIIDGGKFN